MVGKSRKSGENSPSKPEDGSRSSDAEGERQSFFGSFAHALDDKGRVSLPASFRQVIEETGQGTVVLTNYVTDGARCLDGFSQSGWLEFEAKLRRRSRFDPKVRKLENFYLARAAVCPVDQNGRINIPPYLRQYAGFEREIVFTATLSGFRVWDSRVWDLIFREAEQALMDDPTLFEDVDI